MPVLYSSRLMVDKNSQSNSRKSFRRLPLWGKRCTGMYTYVHLPAINRLAPVTSFLEGVRLHRAACAATTLVHLHTTSFHWDLLYMAFSLLSSFF